MTSRPALSDTEVTSVQQDISLLAALSSADSTLVTTEDSGRSIIAENPRPFIPEEPVRPVGPDEHPSEGAVAGISIRRDGQSGGSQGDDSGETGPNMAGGASVTSPCGEHDISVPPSRDGLVGTRSLKRLRAAPEGPDFGESASPEIVRTDESAQRRIGEPPSRGSSRGFSNGDSGMPDLAEGRGDGKDPGQVVERMRHLLPLLRSKAASLESHPVQGRVVAATGTIIRAILPNVAVGDLCLLRDRKRDWSMNAEVVGLVGREVLLAPMGNLEGISAETEVLPTGGRRQFPVGQRVLGRVLDALGAPMDGKGPLPSGPSAPITASPPDVMRRRMIDRPLPIGLRAIDSVLTCGEGQRLGIYGEAGGGKSTLMASIVKGSDADVTVVALVGERGREVREFIEHNLGPDGLARSVVVVATSDRPAAERVACAQAATAIAEYFRDQGLKVLLFVDNVTRFARALREIGLAAGEPPTRRGFPPSVFTALPKLMERAGMGERGSITAFYAVLVEDGQSDPIAEETRGILDGHIILSRALAASGHYPAIDILSSRSRVMSLVTSAEHQVRADRLRALWARYQDVAFLLQVGEYKPGGDPLADEAIEKIDEMRGLLRQGNEERTTFAEMTEWMTRLLG